MASIKDPRSAAVGVAENGNSAVLVTVDASGACRDRRHIDLTSGLPTHPYHHEGSWAVGRYLGSPWARKTSLPDAVALVKRVHAAALAGAQQCLTSLAREVPVSITCIAIRRCAPLPATIEERIADTRAACIADSILYRQALATAGQALGWSVRWYDREHVAVAAAVALGGRDLASCLMAMGRALGPPWRAQHKLAATAALAGLGAPTNA